MNGVWSLIYNLEIVVSQGNHPIYCMIILIIYIHCTVSDISGLERQDKIGWDVPQLGQARGCSPPAVSQVLGEKFSL